MKEEFVLDDALARLDMDPVRPSDDIQLFRSVEVSYFCTERKTIHPRLVGEKSSPLLFVGKDVLTDDANASDHASAELRGPRIAPGSRRDSDKRPEDL